MRAHVKVAEVQRSLVLLWASGFLCSFSLIFVSTIRGAFEGHIQEVWGWFLPCVLPTLGLCIAATVAAEGETKQKNVSRFVATLAKFVSAFYLSTVLVTILSWPLSGVGAAEWFKTSGLWLGPLQGAAGGALGLFLVSKRET